MTNEMANKIYDCLVDMCGAWEAERAGFVYEFTSDNPTSEWRFRGKLGFGGKFRPRTMTVDCYREDETPERLHVIECANNFLMGIK